MQAPKIDKRTYAQLVAQTEVLASQFTTQTIPLPKNTPLADRDFELQLSGRVLAQDIVVLAKKGHKVTETLAWQISDILGPDTPIQIISETGRATTARTPIDPLTGHTLAQDIAVPHSVVDTYGSIRISPLFLKDRVLNKDDAKRLSETLGLEAVEIYVGRRPASTKEVDPTPAELTNQVLTKDIIGFLETGTTITPILAQQISDLLGPGAAVRVKSDDAEEKNPKTVRT
ncbi:MAG: hypothetical protein GY796_21395, partial [Chloroflexi bacterium]|nr:hypothetical protein [Chloroflexota bacterium]